MARSSFEKKRTAKALKKIQQLEQQAGRTVSTIAVEGKQKFDWTSAATIALGIYVLIFFVALAMGYIVAPGFLVLIAGHNAVKPKRVISLNRDVVTVWSQGFWVGGVKEPVTIQPRSTLMAGEWTTVPGSPPINLAPDEVAMLASANVTFGPTQAATMPPPPQAPLAV